MKVPQPREICLEDLDLSPDDDRYIRCVAVPGVEPGLTLDREGAVRWMPEEPCAYGLWVSADDRLVLLRAAGAGPITVIRGGRSKEAPCEQPVILLDGDLLALGRRRLKVHVHGETEFVYPPEPTSRSALARAARAAAAALALGAVIGAGGAPIEVRAQPPGAPAPPIRQVLCTISKQVPNKEGPLVIHTVCPAKSRMYKGAYGQLLDPKTRKPIKDGGVVIKKVKGNDIIGEATKLRKVVGVTTVRFYVR